MESLITWKDIGLVSPLIVLFLTSLVPITIKLFRDNKEQNNLLSLTQIALGMAIGVVLLLVHSADTKVTAFLGSLSFDGATKITSIVLILLGLLAAFVSRENINTKGKLLSEHFFLMLSSLIGMLIMVWANDLIIVFIGLEIMSLPLYMLIALSNEQKYSKESAFKYFILGSVASAIFLFGCSLLFGSTGSTYFDQIVAITPQALEGDQIFKMGMFLILIGLLFKVSIVPFHAWSPDVYQGAPTSMSMFMSTAVKLTSFVVLIRILSTGVLNISGMMFEILQVLAVVSIVIGNLAALKQENIKRLLAYSGIAHSGYILIGVLVSGLGVEENIGAASTYFYLFSYVLVSVGLLSLVSLLENSEESFVSVSDLKGLAHKSPVLSFMISLLLLSLAGIPPLAGFFAKFFVFSAAIDMGMFWMALWGVIGSIISIYYYLRPIVYMYMKESSNTEENLKSDFLSSLNIGVAVTSIIIIGIYSGSAFEWLENVLASSGL